MYVPRFGKTNIVYDVINGNNILTTTTNKIYGTIEIQDGILTHSNEKSNFNSPTGILYGSDTGGKWSLASTDITNGILTKSNDLTFDSHTGLLYGKSTGKQTWSLDSVIIDKGILTKSNNTLGFNSLTGILYGSATATGEWSLESTKITDGIFTRSNNTLVFNNPNGLLYGSTENGVWSLNKVNNLTSYADSNDYVLYYGKDTNDKVTPHWKILTIDGKNFSMKDGEVSHQWRNIVTNSQSNIVSIQTERFEQQEYGIYNHNGKVVKLNTKVLNDIGLKFFSPSEINETGYITTNVIIYNSSADDVTLPVNYYTILNFHSLTQVDRNNIGENLRNTQYSDGFYNYVTVSNNLPIYEQIENTFNGFYNFVETNNIATNNNYLHFTTSLFIDSIIMPPSNNNYTTFKEQYNFNSISNYKCIIGIQSIFGKVEPNTFYQNIFFCNETTPVLSKYNTDVLLGYLIVDLKDIDENGKVNINQTYDIDSTVPYNSTISNFTVSELKNGLLTFRPLYYISNSTCISLHYNQQLPNFISCISNITSSCIEIINNDNTNSNWYNRKSTIYSSIDYLYVNDKLRFTNNMYINSTYGFVFKDCELVIPYECILSTQIIENGDKVKASLNYVFCDTDNTDNLYYLQKYFKPFSLFELDGNFISDPILGYGINDKSQIYNACLNTKEQIISNTSIILNPSIYTVLENTGSTLIIRNNDTDKEIKISNATYEDGYIKIKNVNDYHVDNLNNLINNTDNDISFTYKTYEISNIRIDPSVVFINPTTENLHVLICKFKYDIVTSFDYTISDKKIKIFLSNNIYKTDGNIYYDNNNQINYNNIIYNIADTSSIYEYSPFILKGEYVYNKEIIIDNLTNKKFIYTNLGVIYTDHYIFSAKDVQLNVFGQIVVNSNKYNVEKINDTAYSIKNKDGYEIISSENIIYNEYIEILNSSYCCITKTINNDETVHCLCKYITDDKSILEISQQDNYIQITKDNDKLKNGANNYGTNNSGLNDNNIIFDTIYVTNDDSYNKVERSDNNISVTLSILKSTGSSGYSYIFPQGIATVTKNTKYIMKLPANTSYVIGDNYFDIPFFETPIEKDMKIVLKPISKYSILSYNNKSYTNQAYTLAKNVGFKISLCNIYVTLTSYIGEYPSMIN